MTLTVTILGGNGKVALIAAKLLVNKGYSVRSLFRNPDQAEQVEKTGAKGVIFDLEKASPDEYKSQLAGSDVVIWSAGAGGKGGPERTDAVDRKAAFKSIEAAQLAKVKRFITVSFLYAERRPFAKFESMKAYGEAKADADEFLKISGLDWTIVGPGSLSTEDGTGKIELNPDPEATVRRDGKTVSRENVAKVLVAVVENPEKTRHKTIDFVDGDLDIVDAILGL